ncbi:hypothetical protein CROQUDRAFT_101912 [Cronartium quercuum f. sp. fusiforme G11]|uniref:Uncharacterized protein n=1 Tax=Cronartium quercuum f. sp. fusiforme G11 TaxID=708437 RepID=A0A9P6T6A9_9BASI|nr:hypothetical protein CROQUDRAFT_101912 [Cronartium quercuum f. sp. fusiforme G11]
MSPRSSKPCLLNSTPQLCPQHPLQHPHDIHRPGAPFVARAFCRRQLLPYLRS